MREQEVFGPLLTRDNTQLNNQLVQLLEISDLLNDFRCQLLQFRETRSNDPDCRLLKETLLTTLLKAFLDICPVEIGLFNGLMHFAKSFSEPLLIFLISKNIGGKVKP